MNLRLPSAIGFVAHGAPLGLPMPIWLVLIYLTALWLLIERTVFGQRIAALGLQRATARLSGLPVRRDTALVYVLDAIGATFIGTTLRGNHRPSIEGTVLGVLMLSVAADGLVLVGWSFEWQQIASGLLVLAILAISFGTSRSPA